MNKIKISEIIVENRARKIYGDLDSLERSIRNLGVLEPIGVTQDNKLIFGGRRLQACKNLKLETIPAMIFNLDLDNPIATLQMERDENNQRLDLTPSEKVEIGKRIEETLKGRQGKRTDLKLVANSPQVEEKNILKQLTAESPEVIKGESREIVAKLIGMKPTAYRQAKAVVDSDNQEIIQAMDSGEKSINSAYESIRKNTKPKSFKITLFKNSDDDAEILIAKCGNEYCTKLALAMLKSAGHNIAELN